MASNVSTTAIQGRYWVTICQVASAPKITGNTIDAVRRQRRLRSQIVKLISRVLAIFLFTLALIDQGLRNQIHDTETGPRFRNSLPSFSRPSILIGVFMITGHSRVDERELRCRQPLLAKDDLFIRPWHLHIAIGATDQEKEEVAHHLVVPKAFCLLYGYASRNSITRRSSWKDLIFTLVPSCHFFKTHELKGGSRCRSYLLG